MCDVDGEADQCIPCPPGMVQLNNVSSLNMDEAECYSTKGTETCMIGVYSELLIQPGNHQVSISFECLFDLVLYVPSTIFQLNRDGSSWVEPVLS